MMAALQSSTISSSSTCISSRTQRVITRATIHMPKFRINKISLLPKLPTRSADLVLQEHDFIRTRTEKYADPSPRINGTNVSNPMVLQKLYAIMEAVSDRVEMHKNIGEQRNNWNSLLLTSINTITLAAATMAGIAASSAVGAALMPLKLSSTLMYLAATGMLFIMNKIQPSQLAEEQRNAARLFKQLHGQIQTLISIGNPTAGDVNEAMERVLALDKAYPLPLLGVMLEKFPSSVEPAVWWPQSQQKQVKGVGVKMGRNGWSENLENELREISGVMKRKDEDDYLRLGEKALKLNKVLAISGPLLTGLAAVGAAFVGPTAHGSLAAVVGVAAGALASVVNTIEHSGQVGMVFEMYRSNAGFFRQMEESIEKNLEERKVERRENGELFEMKVALQLGRSLSQLKNLATASSKRKGEDIEEFASKLF